MYHAQLNEALECAVSAAQAAGRIMRDNLHRPKKINLTTPHDIKLALDVRCQKRIQALLQKAFPKIGILGEEGDSGDVNAVSRWVVDPLDGTVNFAHGIPHACVSIALQVRGSTPLSRDTKPSVQSRVTRSASSYKTLAGVVFDPFHDELWTALQGQPARLNGRRICVSSRALLKQSIVAIGFGKNSVTLERMLPAFNESARRARKVRIMGAAALGLAYVACGRLDAYSEYGLRLWDIAAGGLIVECAGGEFWHRPVAGVHAYHVIASNRLLAQRVQHIGR